jgi:hypothetical protein
MIKLGMVAGPFDSPPLPGFRANPLFAVEQIQVQISPYIKYVLPTRPQL